MDFKTIALWVFIVILIIPAFLHGYQKFVVNQEKKEMFDRFGYSITFMRLIGIAEIIIGIGILFETTRLWAMASYTIIILGAIYTHFRVKDPAKEKFPPFFVLTIIIVIYFLSR